ncbi:MAG: transcriptional regulator [Solirubrobacterales bacterium]|nr:transcriptional regulator [Solirubrobacterales bacterium]
MRSYDEYCAVAKSLDVVGDRWTLLIVRELALRGGCRYTDLRNGLPGIASNLLADRLRELEQAGVVRREEAPPPIATTLFHLTPRGQELRPLLDELVRWGLPLMVEQKPSDAVRSHWLVGALELMLIDHRPHESPVEIEIRTGDQPVTLESADGTVRARLGPAEDPDLTLSGDPNPILGLLFGKLELVDAQAAGVSSVGDPAVLDRINGAFQSPTSA